MRIPTPLLLLVLAQTSSLAEAFSPHHSFSKATERIHKFAKRKSASLARDLRVVFQGIKSDTGTDSGSSHRVYCVRPSSDPFAAIKGNSTSPATATTSGTASRTASRTGSSTGTATRAPVPSATSAFKLVESHVGCDTFLARDNYSSIKKSGSNFFDGWSFWDTADPTGGTLQWMFSSPR